MVNEAGVSPNMFNSGVRVEGKGKVWGQDVGVV